MRARPEPSDAGAPGRCASRALHPRALLVVLLAAAALLAPAAGALLRATPAQAARPQALAATAQPVVLADDEGLRLVGPVAALGDKPAPDLDDLSPHRRRQARRPAAGQRLLPRRHLPPAVALPRAGAAHLHPAQGDLRRAPAFPCTAIRTDAGSSFAGGPWSATSTPRPRRRSCAPAATRSASRARGASCVEDGYRLVVYTHAYTPTTVLSPVTLASGATSDPAVIQAVMDVTGQTEDKAKATLVSYDSTTEPVKVLRLTSGAVIVRNWSGTSTVGRWFAPSGGGALPSPEAARAALRPARRQPRRSTRRCTS